MADKVELNNAFHDWLSASAYDQTARVVSKKEHRSKQSAGVPDTENERLEAEQRFRVVWKLSNRRYCRCRNDLLLRELAPPLDATQIASLFAPPPWGEKSVPSPFKRAKALQHRVRHQGKNLGIDAQRHNVAIVAWQGVSHRSRDALRRNASRHLVNLFEEKILHYLTEMGRGGPSYLVLDVDDAYHRMLVHGICEFHCLSSKTISNMEDGEGTAVMIKVNAKRKNQDVPVSLMQFLTDANKRASSA